MIAQSARIIRAVLGMAMLVLLVSGCGSQPVAGEVAGQSTAKEAVSIAMQQVGVPYRYGGTSPQGFDCSGLVYYAYANAGKRVPRTTTELWQQTQAVSEGDMQVGDILFFRIEGKVSHVGMYVGGGKFVHAPSSGRKVALASLRSDFYQRALIRAGRLY